MDFKKAVVESSTLRGSAATFRLPLPKVPVPIRLLDTPIQILKNVT
jgi:hypothetical protein